MAYSILHQIRKGTGEKEYQKTMTEFHRAVFEESDQIDALWKHNVNELASSAVQATRGTLMQFLTLPLDTDVKEIHRILKDHYLQFASQLFPDSRLGISSSVEGRVVFETDHHSVLQKMMRRGKEYLKEMGFAFNKDELSIYESRFFVEGGINLDMIEHIVRDRMGIYLSVHGKHLEQHSSRVFSAHNLVDHKGTLNPNQSKFEGAIHFSKGKQQYAQFRKKIGETLESLQSEYKFDSVSMWQRKLGLGLGSEFNIRIRSNEKRTIRESILHMAKSGDKETILEPMIKNGQLVMKEFLS
jgi:hypothetical protein